METKLRAPSHICPQCGEWWMVEPIEENIWNVVRYSDHTRSWNELVFAPVCPDCKQRVLEPWLIDDTSP